MTIENMEDERRSLEELLRCGLSYAGAYGVARLRKQDLVSTSRTNDPTENDLTIRLLGCQRITPKGHLIYIHPDDDTNEDTLVCSLNRFEETLLYVGVGEMQEYPAVSYNAGARKHLYMLSTQKDESYLDWLAVGRVERGAKDGKLGLDTDFIPECLSMQSHAGLLRRAEAIRDCANACCEGALAQMKAGQGHYAAFSYPLAVAATFIDKLASPRAYLERLLAVVRSLDMLHLLLPTGQQRSTLKTHTTAASGILTTRFLYWTIRTARNIPRRSINSDGALTA